MQKHPKDTHGLSRSPIRAIFQNIPRNLRAGPADRVSAPNRARVNARPPELVAPPPPAGAGRGPRGGPHAPLS